MSDKNIMTEGARPKATQDAAVSVRDNYQIELLSKMKSLESELLEANRKIAQLQNELMEERTKNRDVKNSMTTTSDDTKKRESASFEKLRSLNNPSRNLMNIQTQSVHDVSQESKNSYFRNAKLIGRTAIKLLKRAKSIETPFKHEFNQSRNETQEDIEFQKSELQAIYEAKIDQIFSKKSRKESIKESLREIQTSSEYTSKKLIKNWKGLHIKTRLSRTMWADLGNPDMVYSAGVASTTIPRIQKQ